MPDLSKVEGFDASNAHAKPPQQLAKIVYLVRHGEGFHNVIKDWWGERRDPNLADPALTATGEDQARAAVETLKGQLQEHGDGELQVVVSSSLRRALKTAELGIVPVAPDARRIIFEAAGEVLCDDIWNETRDRSAVASDWPEWTLEDDQSAEDADKWLLESRKPTAPLDNAQTMLVRAELIWQRLCSLPERVIAVSAHSCFLYFLLQRLSAEKREPLPPWETIKFANGEVRRLELPPYEGQSMHWSDFSKLFPQGEADLWSRYSKRAAAIAAAGGKESDTRPEWALREWRFSREPAEFDADLPEWLSSN
eukprot:TRINITY_DN11208_c0_g1_i2.p1 TRINITY_DN11208_c0_g1~~TRINITY_DN11208_c0_g1_i2.p1  ORF type:complete len:310 (+),score=66.87 TRINITY_DN11208_c0_g1_i2:74-1003(+)